MSLRVSEDLSLPGEAVTWVISYLAKRGAGKTYCAADQAEEMLKAKIPIVVLDGMGIWWGLRVSADGVHPGLPVVVFGGEHGDLPLAPEKAADIAKAVVESNISCVLDLSPFSKYVARKIVKEFLDTLYRLNRAERHVFIEEADLWCLSEDTEILSITGWRPYSEVKEGTIVLTMNPKTGQLEYRPVDRVIVKNYEGPMISFKTRTGLDSLKTPDHRVLMQTYDHGKYGPWKWKETLEFRQAKEVPSSGFRVPAASAKFDGTDYPEDLMKLLGWIITDGSWNDKSRKSIRITQSKPRGVKEIRRILQILQFNYTESTRQKQKGGSVDGRQIKGRLPIFQFYISTVSTLQIKQFLGNELHRIPRKLLVEASPKSLRALYDGLIGGDGTGGHYITRKSRLARYRINSFYSYRKNLSDDFQELCVKIGIRALKRSHHVGVSERYPFHYVDRKAIRTIQYKGKVWDLTVPNGTFVVRRNGAVFITGNCPQRPIGQDEALCLSAVDNFVRRGGNHNLGCTLITQRSAVLNKDILTQSDCLVILRTLAPQDKKAIQLWVEEQTDKDKTGLNEWYDSLKELENGQAWVWHPEKPAIFKKVQFRQRETFHATREFIRSPGAGKIVLMGVDEFVERFKKVFESSIVLSKGTDSQQSGLSKVIELEEFRSGHKIAESVQGRLKYLAEVKLDLEKRMKSMEDALKDYDDLRGILSRALRVQNIYDNIHRAEERLEKKIPTGIPTAGLLPAGEAAVGLQKVKTVVAIQEVSVSVPTIRTDTVKGKILALARDASFFDSWKSVKEISAALVDEYRFNASDQAINGALKEIVDQQILGVKYTDRNRWKLSPDVVFEAKKEAS